MALLPLESRQKTLFDCLTELKIEFQTVLHPPVFTVEESKKLLPPMDGQGTKNLLLQEEKTNQLYFLILAEDQRLDLKQLKTTLGSNRFSFAKPELVEKHCQVQPGSLTLLSLLFDKDHQLRVIIDDTVYKAPQVACHPLINTATLILPQSGLHSFLQYTGHPVFVLPFAK